MLSAGLLGGPGIGYTQDYYASSSLKKEAPAVYDEYKSSGENQFLLFPEIQGLDGTKVGAVLKEEAKERTEAESEVAEAALFGGRMALKITALIPATMAVLYLFLIFYFRARGGYKQIHLEGEQMTGGVEAGVR